MKILLRGLVGLGLSAFTVAAQLTVPEPKPVVGAHMPAISPDGKRIAFVYRGDVWVGTDKGGRAQPLTQHVDTDAYPVFSPDGKWVAFASKRTGNWDIFVVPTEGGAARQITWHAGADIPGGWSPDGKRIVFASKRDSVNNELFAVDVETLRTEQFTEDYATMNTPSFSPDGKLIVYGRYGFPWWRPRYHGSAAQQAWLFNTQDGTRHAVTTNDFQHLWTQFLPDGKRLLTVTFGEITPSTTNMSERLPRITDNALRAPNLWVFDLKGQGKPLTAFTNGAVRYPSVATKNGAIVFEHGADLWLLEKDGRTPKKLSFLAGADDKQSARRYEKLTAGVGEAEPSPDGKTYAFGLKGDIWTVAIDRPKGVAGRGSEFAKRLTDWVGEDADFSWSTDGKKLYFLSDRDFNSGVYEMDVETLAVKPLWRHNEDATGLRLSPDGKQLGFWVTGSEGGLFMLSLETGAAKRLVQVAGPHWRGMGGGDFSWSPDNKWIAYTREGENRAWNIWIVPAAGGAPVNITRLNAFHSQPTWSPDGKYLFFQSNRDGDGLYLVPLQTEGARNIDTDIKFEKPKDAVKVEIDFNEITRRIRRLSSQNPTSDLTVTSEGLIVFRTGGDIWSVSYDGKETKRLTTGTTNANLRISRDGKKAYFTRSGELWSMKLDAANGDRISFAADWERDVREERLASFTQFWRSYHRGFYDDNFHGRDWEAVRKRYEPYLESVETTDEFAWLLQMMVGELEASHSEVTPANSENRGPVTPSLGFTFDYSHTGPGLHVRSVPEDAPGWFEKTRIKPGEYVLAINGRDVTANELLYQWINDKQDREFEFLVNKEPKREGARTVRYKVLTSGDWEDLNQDNRIERTRKYVEDKSGGKIGYLHISAMSTRNQVQFEREVYEYILGKEAMIIDVRFNRGGNISDTLIDWLERKPHGYFRPRDSGPEEAPARAWTKPIIVLMNEHSYSNGEMFPDAMRTRGLARLVGMPTPGYVIWTSSLNLLNGTGARMPQSGVFRLDGSPMENQGEQPDVRVWMTPEDWLAERDPQVDTAIDLLKPQTKEKEKEKAGGQ